MDVDQSKRYLDYFKTISCDTWHDTKDYAPSNPDRFYQYLEMLPFGCYDIDKKSNQFRIIGKL